jgi:regulator of protease activity HflC (stomatin/prohibitin superfamily)
MSPDTSEISVGKVIGIAFVFALFLVVVIGLFSTFYMVRAGERAVITTFGNPSMTPKSEGLHMKIPFVQKATIMDVKTQKYEADLTAASRDLQDVKTKIAINYRLVPELTPEVYKTIGLGYSDKIIYPLEQETNKAVTSQFTAEELISKRESVRGQMKTLLGEKLLPRGIIVEEVSIVDFAFSPSFTQAIEAKVTAEQQALQAKNKLVQVEYEAKQVITAANGKAQAIQIEGDALRNNPQVAQLRAIEKWNGIMPLVVGSATPFIDVSTIAKGEVV